MVEPPIVVQQTLHSTPERVWQALTQVQQMRQWYFPEIQNFEAIPQSRSRFTVDVEGQAFVHEWQVSAAQPHQLLAYTWAYRGYPGVSSVQWKLASAGDQTHLTLTHTDAHLHTGHDLFSRENGVVGWHWLVQVSLVNYLKGP